MIISSHSVKETLLLCKISDCSLIALIILSLVSVRYSLYLLCLLFSNLLFCLFSYFLVIVGHKTVPLIIATAIIRVGAIDDIEAFLPTALITENAAVLAEPIPIVSDGPIIIAIGVFSTSCCAIGGDTLNFKASMRLVSLGDL